MTLKPDFIPSPRWMDAIDIGVVAFIVYRMMLLIRGTRAVQMVLGLALLGEQYRLPKVGTVHRQLVAE